jgi:hypothetical protein
VTVEPSRFVEDRFGDFAEMIVEDQPEIGKNEANFQTQATPRKGNRVGDEATDHESRERESE